MTYLPLLHVVFDRPRGCWRFSNLASSEKSDFALKWGTFSSPRRVAGDSPSASPSQSYHRRLRLFQVELERTVGLFIPLEPLRPSCVAVGEKKKTRVKTFGKEEERHRDTRSPLLFKRRQRGSLRARSWVLTACPTLREKLNNAFLHSPGGFLLQSQRAAPRRVCGRVRAAAALWLTELKAVFL